MLATLPAPQPTQRPAGPLWSRLPILMVIQPSSLRPRGVGKQRVPSCPVVSSPAVGARGLEAMGPKLGAGGPRRSQGAGHGCWPPGGVSPSRQKERRLRCDEVFDQPISYQRQSAYDTHDVCSLRPATRAHCDNHSPFYQGHSGTSSQRTGVAPRFPCHGAMG
jgi:hypothetical protein